jgi:hypothetical protein
VGAATRRALRRLNVPTGRFHSQRARPQAAPIEACGRPTHGLSRLSRDDRPPRRAHRRADAHLRADACQTAPAADELAERAYAKRGGGSGRRRSGRDRRGRHNSTHVGRRRSSLVARAAHAGHGRVPDDCGALQAHPSGAVAAHGRRDAPA